MTTTRTTPAGDIREQRHILRVHFHTPTEDPDQYEQLLDLLTTLTPQVQRLPPYTADLDITGSLRLFDRTPAELAQLLQLRVMALFGIPTSLGLAPNRALAAMAADATAPGHLTVIPHESAAVARFLRPRPVTALPGIGPATARTLTRHGLHTLGTLADTPLLTVQRLLGTALGRQLHDRAHGHDPRPVTPHAPPRSTSATHDFGHDTLDPTTHRQALLGLADELGWRLRTTHQVTGSLALSVRYADASSTTRSRTLDEPTDHSTALTTTGYTLYDGLGLQRARVRTLTLRADNLRPAREAVYQLTFDPGDDKARTIEAVADRARARFGANALRPAALARKTQSAASPATNNAP